MRSNTMFQGKSTIDTTLSITATTPCATATGWRDRYQYLERWVARGPRAPEHVGERLRGERSIVRG
jgi:hypothetical protein